MGSKKRGHNKALDSKSKRTENVPRHVGDRMRKWRRVSGNSLETVGNKIGCTKGHLSAAENAKGNLSLPLFLAFCKAIKTPASRILEDRFLYKNRDVDRLAADIVANRGGTRDLSWLASLSKDDFRLAIRRAREAVAFAEKEREELESASEDTPS